MAHGSTSVVRWLESAGLLDCPPDSRFVETCQKDPRASSQEGSLNSPALFFYYMVVSALFALSCRIPATLDSSSLPPKLPQLDAVLVCPVDFRWAEKDVRRWDLADRLMNLSLRHFG